MMELWHPVPQSFVYSVPSVVQLLSTNRHLHLIRPEVQILRLAKPALSAVEGLAQDDSDRREVQILRLASLAQDDNYFLTNACSATVHGVVRAKVAERMVLTLAAETGADLLPHAPRTYVATAAMS